jgi:hypothetical protein
MRLNLCLLLFAAFSINCLGPKIRTCIPGDPDYGCSDGPMPKQKAVGMICMSSRDQAALLRACKLGIRPPIDVQTCIVTDSGGGLVCDRDGLIPAYGSGTNYSCISSSDFDRFLIACRK